MQTHTVHNCKVTSVFSNTADPGIRRDVAQMLLAAFQSNLKRSAKFETTHEVAAKERHRKKPSKRDGEKRREEKLRGRKRVVSENKAATAQKGKALRHGKGFRGR